MAVSAQLTNLAAGQKRISRFTMSGNTIVPSSEYTILGDCSRGKDYCFDQPKPFHSLGAMLFGLDGSLYISLGDTQRYEGATIDTPSWNGPQEPSDQTAGKILRINPANGDGFPDNPFCAGGSLSKPVCRTWAIGFRNPWTMSWSDESASRLLVSNVGWYSTESLHLISKGDNGGWPCYEGRKRAPQPNGWGCSGSGWTAKPFNPNSVVFQYDHNGQGASIIGGTKLGSKYPIPYNEWFIGAEYVRGNLWANDFNGFIHPPNGVLLSQKPFGNMRAVTRIKRSRIDGLVIFMEMEGGSVKQVYHDATQTCPGVGPLPNVVVRPPPVISLSWKCIQSCNDGGNSLWVRVTAGTSVSCASQWSWNCTWFASSNCDGQSAPPLNQLGLPCATNDPGSWCAEASNQLVGGKTPSVCPVNPPSVAPTVPTESANPWTCVKSCRDKGHSVYARIVDTNTGSIGCLSQWNWNCTWYESPNCDGIPAPNSVGAETRGVTCPSYDGGWCWEAKNVLVAKQPATTCANGPPPFTRTNASPTSDLLMTVAPTPSLVTSVLLPSVEPAVPTPAPQPRPDETQYQNENGGCLAYNVTRNNRCGPRFSDNRCPDESCCSNLGWCSPAGYTGRASNPWCDTCLPGYGKCALPALCPGTGFQNSVVAKPPAKSPYKCIQSCSDKYVF
jgi:hypothetical protein